MSAVHPLTPRTVPAATNRAVAVAAIGYSVAWLVGLAVTSTGTTVTSTGTEVLAAVAGREGAVALQFVVTEMVTALALLGTLREVARRVGDRRVAGLAVVVAGLSALQGVLGLALALVAAPAHDAGLAGALSAGVNRVDGVKMLLLAVLAGLGLRAGLRGTLPRWLTPVAALLAVALTLSGLGYLLLVDSLALAAYASLPLLMLWVTGTGLATARRVQAGR